MQVMHWLEHALLPMFGLDVKGPKGYKGSLLKSN